MFINCRHCHALVATNPATDEPPERCPRCDGALRDVVAPDVDTHVPGTAPSSADATNEARDDGIPGPATAGDAPADDTRPAGEPVAASPERDHREAQAVVAAVPADDPGDAPAATTPVAAGDPGSAGQSAETRPPDTGIAPDDATTVLDARGQDEAIATPGDGTGIDATASGGDVATPPDTTTQDQPARPTPRDGRATAVAKPAPSFAAARRPVPVAAARHRWRVPVIVAALSSLLLLQILLADRARLSADARWRPLLSTLCGGLGCDLPPWHEPTAFRLVARDVRAHPQRPGVLRATATFRNDARWPQAWPRVVLTLSDVEGRTIGQRDFAPAEYLGDTPTENALASGQSAMILLDVVEPAANVVAFSFEFQ